MNKVFIIGKVISQWDSGISIKVEGSQYSIVLSDNLSLKFNHINIVGKIIAVKGKIGKKENIILIEAKQILLLETNK